MRILLDECVNVHFARHITGHEVETVRSMNWLRIRNGELLRLASQEFEVFLTIDRGIRHQQHLPGNLALITLYPRSSKLEDLLPLLPELLQRLPSVQPGELIDIAPEIR